MNEDPLEKVRAEIEALKVNKAELLYSTPTKIIFVNEGIFIIEDVIK